MQTPGFLTRKSACPCGSGNNFGACCGPGVDRAREALQQGHWNWLSGPEVKFLALAAGVAPAPGENPPTLAQMEQALDQVHRRVFAQPTEQEAVQAGVQLIFGLTEYPQHQSPLEPVLDLIGPDEVQQIVGHIERRLEGSAEPGAREMEQALREALRSNVSQLLQQVEVELLPWRLAQALRRPGLGPQEQAALILALTHAVDDEKDPLLWEILFVEALRRDLNARSGGGGAAGGGESGGEE